MCSSCHSRYVVLQRDIFMKEKDLKTTAVDNIYDSMKYEGGRERNNTQSITEDIYIYTLSYYAMHACWPSSSNKKK